MSKQATRQVKKVATAGRKSRSKATGGPTAKKKPERKTSAIDAAAKVLAESRQPMTTREMIDAMTAKGYWTSPGGKTPHATLYSAILREIGTKGKEARFKKTDAESSVSPDDRSGHVAAHEAPQGPRVAGWPFGCHFPTFATRRKRRAPDRRRLSTISVGRNWKPGAS